MDDSIFEGLGVVKSQPQDGFFIDFLGIKTRVSYFDQSIHYLSGQVFGVPQRHAVLFFEFEEWQGFMAALREAKDSFSCIELGCGWGPWLVTSMVAARMRGIRHVELVGVEAEPAEISHLRSHFRDNGLDPDDYTIVNAAIDDHDARATPENPGGAPLLALETLLSGRGPIDLIHCDIQFAESRAFRAGIEAVTQHVRRVIVGTHSRKIEDELIETFVGADWRLEYEAPCKYRIADGRPHLLADGAQVWRNPTL